MRTWSLEKTFFVLSLLLFIVGCLLRVLFFDFSDLDYGVFSDHFINAVTAKNIATGLGWSSSGYETYILNPENLTTGATVVLPVAGVIALLGNKIIAPGVTVLLLNLFLFFWMLVALRRVLPDSRSFYTAASLFVWMFLFYKNYYWYRMLGEVSALLLVVIAAIYIFLYLQEKSRRYLMLACLAGFLCSGTKEITLLPLSALVLLCLLYKLMSGDKESHLQKIYPAIIFLVSCLAVPLCFHYYASTTLSKQPTDWQHAYHAYENAIHDYYSGLPMLKRYFAEPSALPAMLLKTIASASWRSSAQLMPSIAGFYSFRILLLVYALVLIYIVIARKFRSVAALMVLINLPILLWFFTISDHAMSRHIHVGMLLILVAVIFLISSLPHKRQFYFSCGLFAIFISTGDAASRNTFVSFPIKDSALFNAIMDTNNEIQKMPPRTLAWMGMIDNNEFEYLAKTPNGFVNGFDLLAGAMNKPGVEVHMTHETLPASFHAPVAFDYLHFKPEALIPKRRVFHTTPERFCDQTVYENEFYRISHCTQQDFLKRFSRDGGIRLHPRLWMPGILLPAERMEVLY